MHVLIVKTSSMGDIIHTLPSLTDAAKKISNITFDWVVEEDFFQIPSWHNSVNRIIPVSIRRWCKSWFSSSTINEIKSFKKILSTIQYDVIIDAQGLIKSAVFITYFANGIKHGFNWKTVREPLASFFYNCCHEIDKKNAIERTRELFSKSLSYLRPNSQPNYGIKKCLFYNKKLENIPYCIFLHSTTRKNKHWPEKYWRQLIDLLKCYDIYILLPWRETCERQRAERLAEGYSYVNVLPKLSLNEIAEKIVGAKVIVSVDTGLSHLSTALGKPNITLFGPTDPKFVCGNEKNQYKIISYSKHMKDISAKTVFSFMKEIFIKNNVY